MTSPSAAGRPSIPLQVVHSSPAAPDLTAGPRGSGAGGPLPVSGLHTTLAAVDIIGFGDPRRTNDIQLHLRRAMYEQLAAAFTITALPWWDCYREDRGDGCLIIAPPTTDPDDLLDPLAHHLTALLRRHNRLTGDTTRLRLRLAVHTGYIHPDAHGVTGHALNHTFRLLDAPAFKRALADSDTDLGLIISDQLHTEAIHRGGHLDPKAYRPLSVTCKQTKKAKAWLWLPPATP